MAKLKLIYSVLFDDPGSDELPKAMLIFTLFVGAFALFGGGIVLWTLTLLSLGALVWVVRMGMDDYYNARQGAIRAAAHKWAYEGADAEKVRFRFDEIETRGASAALVSAGLLANLDGAPMVGDSGVDIYGRGFGDISDTLLNFDPTDDLSTGMSMDTNDAYSSPFGMDIDVNQGFNHDS